MKKKFYRTDKLRMQTKVEIWILTLFLTLILVTSVLSVNRTISNTHDDIDTFIRNSKGNYWEATDVNLQAAIDDLGTTGGIVWLPNTKIILDQRIIYINESDITLVGQGTELEMDTSDESALQALDGHGMIQILADRVVVDGIEIDGAMIWNGTNYPSYGAGDVYGIRLYQAENCVIRNCHIHHQSFGGIVLTDSHYNLIEDNHVHHIGNISDCTSVGGPGIRLTTTPNGCKHNVIKDNYVHHIREHGIKIYYSKADHHERLYNKVLFNYIENVNMGNWDGGPYPYGSGIDIYGAGNLVEGNTIIANDLIKIGIPVQQTDNIVKNNQITYTTAIADVGIYICSDNTTVTGNIIDMVGIVSDQSGINIKNCNHVVLSNNIIKNAKYGIYLGEDTGANNCTVIGNTLRNCEVIYLKTAKNNIIAYNELGTCTGNPPIAFTAGGTAENNIVKDNIGYDYSSYQYIPAGTSNPYQYSGASAGATWLNTTTGDLGIYDGSSWIWK